MNDISQAFKSLEIYAHIFFFNTLPFLIFTKSHHCYLLFHKLDRNWTFSMQLLRVITSMLAHYSSTHVSCFCLRLQLYRSLSKSQVVSLLLYRRYAPWYLHKCALNYTWCLLFFPSIFSTIIHQIYIKYLLCARELSTKN